MLFVQDPVEEWGLVNQQGIAQLQVLVVPFLRPQGTVAQEAMDLVLFMLNTVFIMNTSVMLLVRFIEFSM
ncbi:hypothetical protein CWE08_07710 [Aliidiomarina iranensis]|uniref:Uncharacterized protein n=1 Tax=Aliidiomarina iranensis TaxID=1434071 RepID=A0A432VWJ9_9GAMM|nr:hypothetical protein CWE08_07710 [Aliidiomarina iranensis]